MAKAKITPNQARTGCLLFFALPFLAVGVGMTYWTSSAALKHSAVQSWVEVPATIQSAELKQSHVVHNRGRARNRTNYKATAAYTYEYEGKPYRGQTVGLLGVGNNFGGAEIYTYNLLKQHLDSGKPLPCLVNPQEPAESILFPQLQWQIMSFFTAFAAVFGSAGLGMLTAALVGARRKSEHVASDAPTDEPWRMRADWSAGLISSRSASPAFVPGLAVVSLWWWIATAPLTLKLPAMLAASDSNWKWITLAFPLIGTALLSMLTYYTVQRRKYGESMLQLASVPGVIGGQLAGVVQIPQTIQPDGGFQLKFSCIEFKQGRKRDNHEVVLWQDEHLVAEPMRGAAIGSTAIPVLFAIPYEAKPSSRSSSKRNIRWILDVFARTSGVDYRTRFEVPVFKTAESRADFTLDERLSADCVTAPQSDFVLREAGIHKEPLPGGGVRLVFPAARNLGSAVFATVVLTVLAAIVWFLRSVGAPIIFPIVFGLVGLGIFLITLDLWFYRSVVEARSDGITFRGGLLGIGRKRFWTAGEIKELGFDHSMSSGRNVWKNVEIKLTNKEKKTIAKSIGSKPAQEAVVDELNAALGRGAA